MINITLYEQIMVVIFLGLFWIVAIDLYQSAKSRKIWREGYEEEKRRRKEYRAQKLINQAGILKRLQETQMLSMKWKNDWYKWVQEIYARLDRIDHDHQQQKTRLTWSKKREKKDLLEEAHKMIIPTTTGSSTPKYFVHTKPKKYNKK